MRSIILIKLISYVYEGQRIWLNFPIYYLCAITNRLKSPKQASIITPNSWLIIIWATDCIEKKIAQFILRTINKNTSLSFLNSIVNCSSNWCVGSVYRRLETVQIRREVVHSIPQADCSSNIFKESLKGLKPKHWFLGYHINYLQSPDLISYHIQDAPQS